MDGVYVTTLTASSAMRDSVLGICMLVMVDSTTCSPQRSNMRELCATTCAVDMGRFITKKGTSCIKDHSLTINQSNGVVYPYQSVVVHW